MGARIRKGDNVVVISGKDKGKTGKVTRVIVEDDRVVVEGVNLIKRHSRPTPRNPSGGIRATNFLNVSRTASNVGKMSTWSSSMLVRIAMSGL